MTRKQRYELLIEHFDQSTLALETELHYRTPFELLVAVVLSAQCTDKRVNLVSPALFDAYPTPESMSKADFDLLFPLIKSISYPNNKTKHLLGLSKMLVKDFNCEVPLNIDDLQKLPGVGRKTANVIVSVLDEQPAMAVDTHVFRVSKRIGLVTLKATTPLEVEKQLVKHFPEKAIYKAHHWLILHGRYTCLARTPKCGECKVTHLCRFFHQNN